MNMVRKDLKLCNILISN